MQVEVDEVELLEQLDDECLVEELQTRGFTVYRGSHNCDYEALQRALLANDTRTVYETVARLCADVLGHPVLLPVQR